MGKVFFEFSVGATSLATPVPPPYGFAMATASNTLTVTPDTKAAAWRHQYEPTYFRTVNSNGQGIVKMNDQQATDDRRVTTSFTQEIFHVNGIDYISYNFGRNLFFDTFGFAPWPLSTFVLNASGPATIFDQDDHLMILTGIVSSQDLIEMSLNNTPKTVVATGTATEVLSGISRTAKLTVDYFAPQSVVSQGPWERVHKHDTSNPNLWDRVSPVVEVDEDDGDQTLQISSNLVQENSVTITNSVSATLGITLGEYFVSALSTTFGTEYGQTASIAKEKGYTLSTIISPIEGMKVTAWYAVNPFWNESQVKCASYDLDGYNGDFSVIRRRWESSTKLLAELNDSLIQVVKVYEEI